MADGVRARLGALRGRRSGARREAAWLALWGLLLAAFALPEYASFAGAGQAESTAFAGAGEQLRTIAAIGARYLSMAATSLGVAAFQEPAPARSWLDPRWLAAIPLGAVLAWRAATVLYARKPEAAWWIGAAAAWAPVSQVFPFLNPIADRYLYFMLPGLIGGASLWLDSALRPAALRRAAVAAAAALAVVLRARVRRTGASLARRDAAAAGCRAALPRRRDGALSERAARGESGRRGAGGRRAARGLGARARPLHGVRPGPGARADPRHGGVPGPDPRDGGRLARSRAPARSRHARGAARDGAGARGAR